MGPSCPPASLASLRPSSAYTARPSNEAVPVLPFQVDYRPSVPEYTWHQSFQTNPLSQVAGQTRQELLPPIHTSYEPNPPSQFHRTLTQPPQGVNDPQHHVRPFSAYATVHQQPHSSANIHVLPAFYPVAHRSPAPHDLPDQANRAQEMLPPQLPSSDSGYSDTTDVRNMHISRLTNPRLQAIVEAEKGYAQRPSTAPVRQEENTLSQLLPPRRELPFLRPSSQPKSRAPNEGGSPSRPSSSTAHASSRPHSAFVDPTLHPGQRPSSAKALVDSDRTEPLQVNAPGVESSTLRNIHPPLPSVSSQELPTLSLTSKRPLSSLGDNASNARQGPEPSPNGADGSLHATGHSASKLNVQSAPHAVSDDGAYLDRVAARVAAETGLGDATNLSMYSAQSTEERKTIINDWMMQHLEDDDFLTLCQDVSGCWRRIGLGL